MGFILSPKGQVLGHRAGYLVCICVDVKNKSVMPQLSLQPCANFTVRGETAAEAIEGEHLCRPDDALSQTVAILSQTLRTTGRHVALFNTLFA